MSSTRPQYQWEAKPIIAPNHPHLQLMPSEGHKYPRTQIPGFFYADFVLQLNFISFTVTYSQTPSCLLFSVNLHKKAFVEQFKSH